jgi:hypothetical protein
MSFQTDFEPEVPALKRGEMKVHQKSVLEIRLNYSSNPYQQQILLVHLMQWVGKLIKLIQILMFAL